MGRKHLVLTAAIAIGASFLVAPATSSAQSPPLIAVIDAGSSGSRLALYSQATGIEVTRIYRAARNTAGLSSFAANPTSAGPDGVQPLLDQLREYLDSEEIAVDDVPVALLATAGMRRLRIDDPAAARAIFASTRATITSAGFSVKANKILPGSQEALLAWLDANAGAGTLGTKRRSIGIVEVGGASAQVAFRSPRATGPGVSSVRVSGRDIHVVAISYLGLGANEARDLMQVKTSGGEECFPNNASGTDPVNYLANSAIPVSSASANFLDSRCGRAYTKVIKEVAGLSPRELRPRRLSALPGFSRADFVGAGSIPAVYADFRISPGSDDRRALRTAMRDTCTGPDAWQKVRGLFPTPTPSFAETNCSSASYLWQLLFGGRGIGLTPATFDARPELPGGEPSWPEGYAITALHP